MKSDYIFKQRKENVFIFPNVFVIGHVFTKSLRKILRGNDFGETMCVWKDDVMYWYASDSKVKAAAKELFVQLTRNPNFIKQAISRFVKKAKPLLNWVKKNSQKDFSKISNVQLDIFWSRYLELYELAYIESEPLVICMEEYLSGYLFSYLEKKNYVFWQKNI